MKRNFLLRLIAKLDLFAVKGFNPLHEQIFETGLIILSPGPYSLKFYPLCSTESGICIKS